MEKPSVRFRTPSEASWKSGQMRPKSNESLDTTRRRFLTAPEVPISDEEARKREEKLKELQKQKEKQKKKKKKKIKQHPEMSVIDDDDKDGKRAQELQERHMRAMDDLTKLRNHYYQEYMTALDAKVIQQRRDIKKKSDELRRKIELKKLKEMEASHHVKKRLTRSVANVDNTFLKNLPKSRLYQIMAHQSKLMRDGKLNCLEDVEKFWEDVSDPETFYRMVGGDGDVDVAKDEDDVKSQGSNHSGNSDHGSKASSLASLQQFDKMEGGISLSRIAEDKEPTFASIKRNSINGHGSSSTSSTTQQTNKQFKSSRKPVHPKVAEMEQRFPRVEFPEMLALHMDLDPPKEDPEIVEMRDDYRQRGKVRSKEKKRLRKMYEMSLTHQASTQRLFDKNEDFSEVMGALCVSDVGGMLHQEAAEQEEQEQTPYGYPSYNPALPLPLPSHRNNSLALPLSEITRLLEDTIPEEREEDILSPSHSASTSKKRRAKSLHHQSESGQSNSSRESSASSHHSRRRERHLEPIAGRKPTSKAIPLTIDSVMENDGVKVKDVTCLSTLWTNYARDLPTMR